MIMISRILHKRSIKNVLLLYASVITFIVSTSYSKTEALAPDPYQLLEKARYLYDIEGDSYNARNILYHLSQNKQIEGLSALSNFYLAKIFDEDGVLDSSAQYFQTAVKLPGLGKKQLLWAYGRLLELKPELVHPITMVKSTPHKLGRSFIHMENEKADIVLHLLRENTNGVFVSHYESLNSRGLLNPINFTPGKDEVLYDMTSKFILSGKGNQFKYRTIPDTFNMRMNIPVPVTSATIISLRERAYVINAPGALYFYKGSRLTHKLIHRGSKCGLYMGQSDFGALFCDDSIAYSLNWRKPQIEPIILFQKPYQFQVQDDHILIQYEDYFELRPPPYLNPGSWKASCDISDRVFYMKNGIYKLDKKGQVEFFHLNHGRRMWKKDFKAKMLYWGKGEVIAVTYYHACIGISPESEINWVYEFGWEADVTPILVDGSLLLLNANGRNMLLNLDLMSIARQAKVKELQYVSQLIANGKWTAAAAIVEKILSLEPGNGKAWFYQYLCLEKTNRPLHAQISALANSARSIYTPPWSHNKPLNFLSRKLGCDWIWKREYGLKHYPSLRVSGSKLLYIENNNQTLVVLDSHNGKLIDQIHIPEELDSRVFLWHNDTIFVNSPSRLYLSPPNVSSQGSLSLPLSKPVCQAIFFKNSLILSDWFGNIMQLHIPESFISETPVWSKSIGSNGILLAQPPEQPYIDAIDITGEYYAVDPQNGQILHKFDFPKGTITDIFSQDSLLFAGYDHGLLSCFNKKTLKIKWKKLFAHQIFSIDGNHEDILVITTSTRQLICIKASTGAILSRTLIPASLISRPTVTESGYWLGTTEPALVKKGFDHSIQIKLPLTGVPGNPTKTRDRIYISTLDGFICAFNTSITPQ